MGQWKSREEWQQFKKKYPQFEKSKSFKSDVGPQMDAFEAECEKCVKMVAQLVAQLQVMRTKGSSLHAALKGYRAVLDELKKDPKFREMDHEFGGPPTLCNNANFAVRSALEKLSPDAWKINFQEGTL
jgi:hypothetical protein